MGLHASQFDSITITGTESDYARSGQRLRAGLAAINHVTFMPAGPAKRT